MAEGGLSLARQLGRMIAFANCCERTSRPLGSCPERSDIQDVEGLRWSAYPTTSPPQPGRSSRNAPARRLRMPQWEYSKIDLNNVPAKASDLDALDDAGKDGWELVGITANNVAYLKRMLEDPVTQSRPRAKPPARRKAAI